MKFNLHRTDNVELNVIQSKYTDDGITKDYYILAEFFEDCHFQDGIDFGVSFEELKQIHSKLGEFINEIKD